MAGLRGWWWCWGFVPGLVFHSVAVAAGVAAIFRASGVAFGVLKYLGAGYLLYLAWQAFGAGARRMPEANGRPAEYGKLYRRGVLMNVTNPKVSLFFLAFLPQFADPSRGPVAVQVMLLGGLFIAATIVVFGGVALVAGTLGQWFARSQRIQDTLNRLAGIVYVGLALKLAMARR